MQGALSGEQQGNALNTNLLQSVIIYEGLINFYTRKVTEKLPKVTSARELARGERLAKGQRSGQAIALGSD